MGKQIIRKILLSLAAQTTPFKSVVLAVTGALPVIGAYLWSLGPGWWFILCLAGLALGFVLLNQLAAWSNRTETVRKAKLTECIAHCSQLATSVRRDPKGYEEIDILAARTYARSLLSDINEIAAMHDITEGLQVFDSTDAGKSATKRTLALRNPAEAAETMEYVVRVLRGTIKGIEQRRAR